MTVTAVYSDGNRKEITEGYQVTGYDANAVGEQTITVTYEGMEASFTVTVKEAETPAPTLEKIEVTAPAKTEYVQGEELDLAGMTVTAVYSDGSTKEIAEGYTVGGYDANVAGPQTVTVTYGGKTASFTVTVTEKGEPSDPDQPTTTPTQEPTDTQKPSDTQKPFCHPEPGTTGRPGTSAATGDQTNLFLPSVSILLAAAVLFAVLKIRKTER